MLQATRFIVALASLLSLTLLANLGIATPKNTPLSQRTEIKAFIDKMVAQHHFDRSELNTLFDKRVKLREKIVSKINHPYEAQPWHRYKKSFVNSKRINGGVEFWKTHQQQLAKTEKTYGVPPEVIIAIIGIETNYGKNMGKHRVLDALSTLAFNYPKRGAFFKRELEQFLLLAREQKMDPTQFVGSYAGAIGQPQFMPSSYRHYAIDATGSGQKDLVSNSADVIASVANYFKVHGWQAGKPVVSPVEALHSKALKGVKEKKNYKPYYSKKQLNDFGLKPPLALLDQEQVAYLTLENEEALEHWFGFNNFYVITRYNRSKLYAMAVHELSQQIASQYKQQAMA